MIRIYLDGSTLEVEQDISLGLTYSIADIEDPISASGSYSKTIAIPATAQNRLAFGDAEQILSPDIFNHAEHTARIEVDGVTVIEGRAYLDGFSDGEYKLQIVGNEIAWVERIRDKAMNELGDEDEYFTEFAKFSSMTFAQQMQALFALVDHGCWWEEAGEDGNKVRRSWATYTDLVPFVSVAEILKRIFKDYTITSSEDGTSQLYITGGYRNAKNADVLQEDNEFEVVTEMKNADEEGYVVTEIIADTTPFEGEPLMAFDTIESDENSRLSVQGAAPRMQIKFTPSENCDVAFDLTIKYQSSLLWDDIATAEGATTPSSGYAFVPVATRAVPRFADTVIFNNAPMVQFGIESSEEWANRTFTDRDNFPNTGFSVAQLSQISKENSGVFYIELDSFRYKLNTQIELDGLYLELFNADNKAARVQYEYIKLTSELRLKQFIWGWQQASSIDIRDVGDAQNRQHTQVSFVFHIKGASLDSNYSYVPAWKTSRIYHLSDTPTLTFSAKMPTPTVYVDTENGRTLQVNVGYSENVPQPYISGTALDSSGNTVNIYNQSYPANGVIKAYASEECAISPKFQGIAPKQGVALSFNDVIGDKKATQMLKAIMQLRNYRIITDPIMKTVQMIPFSEFYTDAVTDWRDRVNLDKEIAISTVGDEIGTSLSLLFQSTSPAVEYYNERHDTPYGSYKYDLANKVKTKGTEVENEVFNAPLPIRANNVFPAQEDDTKILNMAAHNSKKTIDDVEQEWQPTVMRLKLDAARTIKTTGLLADYQQPDMGAVISFADSAEGASDGLHQYYDRQAEIYDKGKKITCYCIIHPWELEELRTPALGGVSFRNRFLLHLNHEDIYCRLESIENWEPANSSHKCTFIYYPEE